MQPFGKGQKKEISIELLEEIYEAFKTPYKYGAVIKFDGKMCDSPTVYSYNGKWYMSFIQIDNNYQTSGYDSHIAESSDLLHWEYVGRNLSRNDKNEWDSRQIAAYAAFVENDFYGTFKLLPINGKYYYSYLGGNLNGYETEPLSIGLCKTGNPLDFSSYEKIPQPILSPFDKDARLTENATLYKSDLFVDDAKILGYKYVNAYNAKGVEYRKETIFLSVSNDGENWERYGDKPVIFDDSFEQNQNINADPQIIKYKDVYVMLYFIRDDKGAYNSFACSYDLIHWKKWTGEPLIKSEYEWENVYAHKPWVVTQDGIVYHYYCAVNDKDERFIAVATSKKIEGNK